MNDNPYQPPEASSHDLEFIDVETAPLASRWLRFLGSIVDGLILVAIYLVLWFILSEIGMETVFLFLEGLGPLALLANVVFGVATFLLVNGRLIYSRGQTVGKFLLGTQVVTEDGVIISGRDYLLKRYLPIALLTVIPLLGPIIALLDALLIFRNNHKCLHDDIASTRVIKL